MLRCSLRLRNTNVPILQSSHSSIIPQYNQTMRKLNYALFGHIAGGSLMLVSSSFMGLNPLPAAVFAGILWMQVMSTAKLTEIGSWVNLCKNVTRIERELADDLKDSFMDSFSNGSERIIVTTDASRITLNLLKRLLEDPAQTSLPTLQQLRELGILHIDESALSQSDSEFLKSILNSKDVFVTEDETVETIFPRPPGAANVSVPKLAEIFKNRQNALASSNKRLASAIANAPPMEPDKMVERLGTAALAMGGAVLVLGGGFYLTSAKVVKKSNS